MRYPDLYTKAILTVIAVLLAWNTLSRLSAPAVHAQSMAPQYGIEVVTANWGSKQYQYLTDLGTAINNAGKGRELVSLIPHDQQGSYLPVYKQQGRRRPPY